MKLVLASFTKDLVKNKRDVKLLKKTVTALKPFMSLVQNNLRGLGALDELSKTALFMVMYKDNPKMEKELRNALTTATTCDTRIQALNYVSKEDKPMIETLKNDVAYSAVFMFSERDIRGCYTIQTDFSASG